MTKVEKLHVTLPFGEHPVQVQKLEVYLSGLKQDRHGGFTKVAGIRESRIVEKGTEVMNLRGITIVGTEELAEIAQKLELKEVTSHDLEANIEISGIPDFTRLAIGTMLKFTRKCVLMITSENLPCVVAGKRVADRVGQPDIEWKFPKAAIHLRGVTAMPFASGIIKVGDEVEVIKPNSFK
jgi:MOSC domain-containing protein YiiM